MSELAHGVVVAHGDLAEALVGAAERISGIEGALAAVSNDGLGPEDLQRTIAEATTGDPTVVFADLASGSCGMASRIVARGQGAAVITGANLPMLLDFLFHRGIALPELVDRLVGKARQEVAGHLPPEAETEAPDPGTHG